MHYTINMNKYRIQFNKLTDDKNKAEIINIQVYK